jgi:hypothetical protein
VEAGLGCEVGGASGAGGGRMVMAWQHMGRGHGAGQAHRENVAARQNGTGMAAHRGGCGTGQEGMAAVWAVSPGGNTGVVVWV